MHLHTQHTIEMLHVHFRIILIFFLNAILSLIFAHLRNAVAFFLFN